MHCTERAAGVNMSLVSLCPRSKIHLLLFAVCSFFHWSLPSHDLELARGNFRKKIDGEHTHLIPFQSDEILTQNTWHHLELEWQLKTMFRGLNTAPRNDNEIAVTKYMNPCTLQSLWVSSLIGKRVCHFRGSKHSDRSKHIVMVRTFM